MGTIYYGGSDTPIHIEDRALAHLKVVIVTKLRRNETFTLSWQHPDDEPRGRSTIWLHPSIPLRFVFDDPEPTELSREWISDLANSVSSTGGIMLVAEHIDAEPETDASERPGTGDVNLGNVEVDSVDIDKLTVSDVKVTPPSQEERKPLEP
ncbi:integrase [Microbacterium thalassium]|uniref:Integrase n=1 Tax=Microbacterium thalassium TaxID=362649 RepID=A0A7X0KT77_9MICO|nr:integrase [Microbacterium thalassium]